MEIKVNISGQEVRFKKSGGTMRRYKAQTGREWFADLDRIARMQRKAAEMLEEAQLEELADKPKKRGKKAEALNTDQIYAISGAVASCYDSDPFYDLLYCMAKEADASIPDTVEEWLDTFDDFPFLEVFADVSPMLSREMSVDAKNA